MSPSDARNPEALWERVAAGSLPEGGRLPSLMPLGLHAGVHVALALKADSAAAALAAHLPPLRHAALDNRAGELWAT